MNSFVFVCFLQVEKTPQHELNFLQAEKAETHKFHFSQDSKSSENMNLIFLESKIFYSIFYFSFTVGRALDVFILSNKNN